jgi:MraZ protein
MFRGSGVAKIDEKGRLKIPARFRDTLSQNFGPKVFVTSFGQPSMRVYPLAVWSDIEEKLRNHPLVEDPEVARFFRVVDRYGEELEVDAQGRLLIPQRLRKHARMDGEVIVMGHPTNYLEVWNEAVLDEIEAREPLTDQTIRFVAKMLQEARHGDGGPPRPGDGPGGG